MNLILTNGQELESDTVMGKRQYCDYHCKWVNFYGNPAITVKKYGRAAVAVTKKVAVVTVV